MADLNISPEEMAALHLDERCHGCGHLSALHREGGMDYYEEYCLVRGCECTHDKGEWDDHDDAERARLQGSGITLVYANGVKADLDDILGVMHALE